MRRAAVHLLLIALGPLAPIAPDMAAAKEPDLAGLLARLAPRGGVAHRSAVVVPLVLVEGMTDAAEGSPPGPAPAGTALTFRPAQRDLIHLRLAAPENAGSPRPLLVPGGTVLVDAGGRERLLGRPILATPGEEIVVRAPACEGGDPPPAEKPAAGGPADTGFASGSLGPVAPLGQRKVDFFLRDPPSLRDLVRAQGFLAGLPAEGPSVRDVLSAPRFAARVQATVSAFAVLPGGYGNGVLGHVAFISNRPVEVLVFATAELYRRAAPDGLRALATSLALHEEFFGQSDLPMAVPDTEPFRAVAAKILAAAGAASTRPLRPERGESRGGDLRLVVGGVVEPAFPFAGRLLLDTGKRPLLLEVFEQSDRVVFPTPWTGPTGGPVDAGPDVSHGAMTKEFLHRLMIRRAQLRGALGW
ncbi:MAG: hypothetical protein MUE73_20030 [Planctomycetes bacterium]|jgi:hypothetical protein|nr:hypothetical protein [Planctomycetota bacterium]